MSLSKDAVIKQVYMDDGGALCLKGSNDILTTTDKGDIYGLYHLRSIDDKPYDDKSHSNQAFEQWIQNLQAVAQGAHICFTIGTPRPKSQAKSVVEQHPDLGMQRYIEKLCQDYSGKITTTLTNMLNVTSVSLSSGKNINVTGSHWVFHKAKYQTDKDILDNSGLNIQQRLKFVQDHPNMDYDMQLQKHYQRQIESQKADMKLAKLKTKLFLTADSLLEKYTEIYHEEHSSESDKSSLVFVSELHKAALKLDLQAIKALSQRQDFTKITQSNSTFSFFQQATKNEIGLCYDEILIQVEEINQLKQTALPDKVPLGMKL